VSTNQITFDLEYIEKRSRLTTFFRWILAIPVWLFLLVYFIAVEFVLIIAWFVLLFTARWPQGLYDFCAGAVRLYGRVNAYSYLGVDQYPPFTGGEAPGYPVQVGIGPPLEKYSRLKVFFLIFYEIPVAIVAWALGIVVSLVAFVSWFVIVITGKQPQGLQDALKLGLSYHARAMGIFFMLTQHYPGISAESGEAGAAGDGGMAAPATPEAPPPPPATEPSPGV
jgi:Domain of unknown function (DUF4389)